MNQLEIENLIKRYNKGLCTEDEKALLETWYIEWNKDKILDISDQSLHDDLLINRQTVLQQIRSDDRSYSLWSRIVAAAAVIIVLFGVSLWYFSKDELSNDKLIVHDIAPGKDGATLTLANGQKISINEMLVGDIATQAGVKISKTKDGQLIYEITSNEHSELAYNTLATARGQQSQVRLPDGTLVFLNSESALRYPTSFRNSDKRIVSLEGEGFFEVSKDKKHPFIVKTRGQEVEVLGTQFNINSYADQRSIRTTLIEGSVKVTSVNNVSKILKPDQQAINSGDGIELVDVESQFFVDWKEGFFMFNNESLESITNRVARWYNIKVVYEDNGLKTKTFIGTISKYENISKVIETLEGTAMASFKLNKDVLTISKRKSD